MDSVERESCFSLRPTVAGVQMQRSQLQVQEHRKVFQRKDKHNVLPFFRSVTEVVHGYLAVYGTPKRVVFRTAFKGHRCHSENRLGYVTPHTQVFRRTKQGVGT